jgi:hypothetical protein
MPRSYLEASDADNSGRVGRRNKNSKEEKASLHEQISGKLPMIAIKINFISL